MNTHKLTYYFVRTTLHTISYLPYTWIHRLGTILGHAAYYLVPKFRKRALSNLSIAKDLNLSFEEIPKVAKASFANLMINCLEYGKFARDPKLEETLICINKDEAFNITEGGRGIVFFCGHQANWETLFLEGTKRMKGVAIGRPIRNEALYSWIMSIRQRFGGKIVSPQNGIKEGFKALKKGYFLGIVGDQGMPDSGFSSDFLGTRAFTSPAPALLAYRANVPLMVATTVRKNGKYYITYSDPIYPDLTKPIEEEMPRLMNKALSIFQDSIIKHPEQWMWQHNRWKQETPHTVYYRFRHDCILIIIPQDLAMIKVLQDELTVLREIYPLAFLTFLIPKGCESFLHIPEATFISYEETKECYLNDYRFKMVLNFKEDLKLNRHYLKLSAFEALNLDDLKKLARIQPEEEASIGTILKLALCRPKAPQAN